MKTANENVIRALAKAMADARAGSIEAVVIVTASPEGQPDAFFAGEVEFLPSINIAIDLAKANVMAQASAVIMAQTTSIRRAVGTLDG